LHYYVKTTTLPWGAKPLGTYSNIVERDTWYFVIDCGKCDRGVVVGEARSPKSPAAVPGTFWKCPYCGHKQSYETIEVQRCQGIYL